MGGKETGMFRLEGGSVQEMDLPLHETIAARVRKGEITRVVRSENKAGEAIWVPFAEEEPPADGVETGSEPGVPRAEHEAALARIAELETALAEAANQAPKPKAPAKGKND